MSSNPTGSERCEPSCDEGHGLRPCGPSGHSRGATSQHAQERGGASQHAPEEAHVSWALFLTSIPADRAYVGKTGNKTDEVAMLKRELEQPSCSLHEIERREYRTRILLMDDDVTD